MSEIKKAYNTGGNVPLTIEAFKNHPSALPFSQGYQEPGPEIVEALIALAGWSQNQVAMITGVSYNPKKGSPTVRRWKTTSGEHKQIPYANWRLMLLAAGVVKIQSDVDCALTQNRKIAGN